MINRLILILFIMILIVFLSKNQEGFQNKERQLETILPLIDKRYIATFIPEQGDDNNDNIIITMSLESHEWKGPLKNSSPDKDTVIIDLTYSKDKRLLGIGYQAKNKDIYKLYIKENYDLESKWINIPQNENIRCILYDYDGTIMGCKDNGQIYVKETKNIESDWVGPINYDLPMKKIMFDKDGKLLGIGLHDNLIYKKKTHNWRESKWDDDHKGNTRVNDIFHDYDGCMIGTSDDGLLKQEYSNFMSRFIKINKVKKDNPKILTLAKILLYRTGVEVTQDNMDKNEDIIDTKLSNDLNQILLFKNETKNLCRKLDRKILSKNNTELLDTNNQVNKINEIQRLIKILQN